ncbi:glutathione peroxidase, partial [Pseudomonas aeruginosa]
FEKFLLGPAGGGGGGFSPRTAPDDPALVQAIEKALG